MDASEITQKIEEREKDFSTLYDCMDRDFDLRTLKTSPVMTDYELATRIKTKSHPSDVEIFSNRPCTFADAVQTMLFSSEMQIQVGMAEAEGEDKRDDMSKLERLFHFLLYKGDERLRRLLLPPLKLSIIELSLLRGGVAGRFLIYKVKDKIIPNFIPLDPRFLTYEVGEAGLLWVAYKTFKSKSALKDEYGKEVSKQADNVVLDFWENSQGNIINSVICENEFLKNPTPMRDELGFDLPSMPILIMPVPNRTSIYSKDKIPWGESIFASIRDVIAARNRVATIVATQANLLSRQPLFNYRDDMGVEIKETVYYAGGVLDLVKGHQEIVPSPMKEISPTIMSMLGFLNNEVEDGALPRIDITSPPASGTALNLVQEAGNRVFNPQLNLLNNFYADICVLIEEQMLASNLKLKLQGMQKNKYYETQVTPVDLKKPHTVKVEFTARTPWRQLDTYQIADMAKRAGLPDAFIQENILKLPDPKGMADLSAIEVYEHSPEGLMLAAIRALDKSGRVDERDALMDLMYRTYGQEKQVQPVPESPTAPEIGGEGIG